MYHSLYKVIKIFFQEVHSKISSQFLKALLVASSRIFCFSYGIKKASKDVKLHIESCV